MDTTERLTRLLSLTAPVPAMGEARTAGSASRWLPWGARLGRRQPRWGACSQTPWRGVGVGDVAFTEGQERVWKRVPFSPVSLLSLGLVPGEGSALRAGPALCEVGSSGRGAHSEHHLEPLRVWRQCGRRASRWCQRCFSSRSGVMMLVGGPGGLRLSGKDPHPYQQPKSASCRLPMTILVWAETILMLRKGRRLAQDAQHGGAWQAFLSDGGDQAGSAPRLPGPVSFLGPCPCSSRSPLLSAGPPAVKAVVSRSGGACEGVPWVQPALQGSPAGLHPV